MEGEKQKDNEIPHKDNETADKTKKPSRKNSEMAFFIVPGLEYGT